MENNQKQLSKFLYNLFGLRMRMDEVFDLVENHEEKDKLIKVAYRLWFVDQMRYRIAINPGQFNTTDYSFRFGYQKQALEKYLLLTCVDSLAGDDFISFVDWTSVKKPAKKKKYNIDDKEIKEILSGFSNLNEPDTFRDAICKVYKKNYLPHYGISKAFLRFFLELPQGMKEILREVYFISSEVNDPYSFVHDEKALSDEIIFKAEYIKNRTNLANEDLVNEIAKYFYKIIRNPYTHEAAISMPKISSFLDEKDRRVSFEVINDNGKKRIVYFSGLNFEEEQLILRLIVVMGWLRRAGYKITEKFIRAYREDQIRKCVMHWAMWEITRGLDLINVYRSLTYNQFHEMFLSRKFLIIETTWLQEYQNHLKPDNPLLVSFNNTINGYLKDCLAINTRIEEQNITLIADNYDFLNPPSLEETKRLNEQMPLGMGKIQSELEKLNIEKKMQEIHIQLDELSSIML